MSFTGVKYNNTIFFISNHPLLFSETLQPPLSASLGSSCTVLGKVNRHVHLIPQQPPTLLWHPGFPAPNAGQNKDTKGFKAGWLQATLVSWLCLCQTKTKHFRCGCDMRINSVVYFCFIFNCIEYQISLGCHTGKTSAWVWLSVSSYWISWVQHPLKDQH